MLNVNFVVSLIIINTLMITSSAVVLSDKSVDEYVTKTQSECFASKRIFSCFRYKAARYIWSVATGRTNLFEKDNKLPVLNGSFNFVQLSEPSGEVIFPEARQLEDDSEMTKLWKFFKRSLDVFLSKHGFGYEFDSKLLDARILSDLNGNGGDEIDGRLKKRKLKFIVPLIILAKLVHLKIMLLKVLIGIGAIQLGVFGGAAAIYYYLKHNTLCKIEPHLIHSHSHVAEGPISGGDNEMIKGWKFVQRSIGNFVTRHGLQLSLDNESGAKVVDSDLPSEQLEESRGKKKRKWQIIFPLILLSKLMHLKMMLMKVIVGIGIIQLILIVGGAFLFHYLKHNTLCKFQPHLVHSHSHVADVEPPEIPYSASYGSSSYGQYGGAPTYLSGHPTYNKDWATSRAYSAYNPHPHIATANGK